MYYLVLVITVLLALLFIFMPELDSQFVGLFYDHGFIYKDHFLVKLSFNSIPIVSYGLALVLLSLFAVELVRKYKPDFKVPTMLEMKKLVYIMLVLIIGPIVVVNGVFKNHWDRPKPKYTQEFGGEYEFKPAFNFTGQCQTNCSFVCGHASVAFAFMAFFFIVNRFRYWFLFGGALWGLLVGLGRIIQGAHYPSDVIFSGLFVFWIAYCLHYVMFKYKFKKTD